MERERVKEGGAGEGKEGGVLVARMGGGVGWEGGREGASGRARGRYRVERVYTILSPMKMNKYIDESK